MLIPKITVVKNKIIIPLWYYHFLSPFLEYQLKLNGKYYVHMFDKILPAVRGQIWLFCPRIQRLWIYFRCYSSLWIYCNLLLSKLSRNSNMNKIHASTKLSFCPSLSFWKYYSKLFSSEMFHFLWKLPLHFFSYQEDKMSIQQYSRQCIAMLSWWLFLLVLTLTLYWELHLDL